MDKIAFDIKYRAQIESGEYRVVTREDRPVEIKIWDLKGDFPVVGVYYDEKNNRDTAVQVTVDGRCSIKPDNDYSDDFFILIKEQSPLPEFVEDVIDIINRLSTMGMTKEAGRKVGERILDKARKQLKKELPRWKKTPRSGGNKPTTVGFSNIGEERLYWEDYSIAISELIKLPKEE